LIPASVRHDLHLIRKIRNDFAHSPITLSFGDEPIVSRCHTLKRVPMAIEPREQYFQSVMGCAGIIDATIHMLKEGKRFRCTVARDVPSPNPDIVTKCIDVILEHDIDGASQQQGEALKDSKDNSI
jgi:hypothetical protein